MKISGFIQFIVGFVVGIILFGTGIAGGAYYFLTRMDSEPVNPTFPENTTVEETPAPSTPEEAPVAEAPEPEPKPEPKPEPEPEAEEEKLPEGAYRARVTWSTGLSLRSNPSADAERVGGVGYNSELIILGSSSDGAWQKVKIAGGTQEGWVKAGNVDRVN
ncbi:MAG: SH3 domain-containing protein [Cyanobacterium sp. T60_A2020_053]|nr:SH3 domain-containing protein [Cyanobacterium sp. T60_A2020_053]